MPRQQPKREIKADEAFAMMMAKLDEGLDLSGEIVALDRFLEDEQWANRRLRPRQRILSKIIDAASNQLPLDTHLGHYPFDETNTPLGFDGEKLLSVMPHCITKDAEGLYWYDEHADWAYLLSRKNKYARVYVNLDENSTEPRTIVLIIGRGGGKTTLAAGIAAHQVYRILNAPDPFKMFNLDGMKAMRVLNVATAIAQANEFFDAFVNMLERVKWFMGRHAPPKLGLVKFGKWLWAERMSSNSKSGRGRDGVVYIHDEIAFAEKTAGARSDRSLYNANRAAVKTRAEGKGLVIILSSPAEADGVLYELYTLAEKGELENSIVVQLAAWEMMPGQTKDNYRAEYRKDEDVAEMEYGAQFFTGARSLLPGVRDLFARMQAAHRALMPDGFRLYPKRMDTPEATEDEDERWRKANGRYDRVVHVDTSEGGDRLVVIVLHVRKGFVVVDMLRVWDREVGYTKELIPFIQKLSKRVPIVQVSFDQFASHQAIQDLQDMGIEAVKTPFTQVYNDEIARNLKQVVFEDRLALPAVVELGERYAQADNLIDEDGWSDEETQWPERSAMVLMREMEAVTKKIRGRFIAAEAPTAGPVQTDDAVDALMAATHQAILKAGGLMEFFTIARMQVGLNKDDAMPHGDGPITERRQLADVQCPHHRGWVQVDATEKYAPCPVCAQPIQTRM